jgi:integrase
MKRRQHGTGRVYQRGNVWWIQYRHRGKRIRESVGTNYKQAKETLEKRVGSIATNTFVGPLLERIRVEELWEPFRDDLERRGKALDHPKRRWTNHLEKFFRGRRVVGVGTDCLNQYVNERKAEGAANATINREMALLRSMFRLGYFSDPPKLARLPKFPHQDETDNVRLGFVEPAQYDKLASAASELWLRAILEVYHTYGWRKREVIGMRVRHADFVGNVLRLDVGTTKNRDGREVSMTASVRALLIECAQDKEPDEFLFTRQDGKRVKDFRHAWRNLCAQAGVSGTLVHDMRRTAARNLRRAGVSEGVIMKIGGWKTAAMFRRYNIVSQTDIHEGLQKLEKSRSAEFGHTLATNAANDAAPAAKRPN